MTEGPDALDLTYAAARREAHLMAGANGDLAQRAMVYHHLYRHSGGNHVFPLLAAHGALWAKGYFATGMRVGRVLSLRDLHRPAERTRKLAALAAFADAFRDINRRVCIEVFATYQFTARYGNAPGVERYVDPLLLEALNRCHHARSHQRLLSRTDRSDLFEAFFRWEQHAVVGPSVDSAVAGFDWDRIRRLSLRPTIRFAYIPRREALRFADFADVDERIEKGLRAFEIAEDAGWTRVEGTLCRYGVLPGSFVERADTLFSAMRARLLALNGDKAGALVGCRGAGPGTGQLYNIGGC
ncbi:MAG: hypothetical protein KDA49_05425 [Rhodospirillaceae bacterium]|nr:hypothetical protein [Rhodospirillaceae bacterium]MCA8931885.1 hypothetical protein [Rhodospirillaceae bacterium]